MDLRADSPTFGAKNTLYVGALRPWQMLIPPGVAHGYKVIGEQPSVLVYVTNGTYNPSDEGRIPYNDPGDRLRLGVAAQVKLLVTGGAGFIGSCFVRMALRKTVRQGRRISTS